jgi:hypothetical protein
MKLAVIGSTSYETQKNALTTPKQSKRIYWDF